VLNVDLNQCHDTHITLLNSLTYTTCLLLLSPLCEVSSHSGIQEIIWVL